MSRYGIELNFETNIIKAKGYGVVWPQVEMLDPPCSCPIHVHNHEPFPIQYRLSCHQVMKLMNVQSQCSVVESLFLVC